MKKKMNLSDLGGLVYSTHPENIQPVQRQSKSIEPAQQQLKVWLEKNGRGGKTCSVIKGYQGSEDELKELAKQIKNLCGTGGSQKEGEIIIQGDHREKIVTFLQNQGYQVKKAGG